MVSSKSETYQLATQPMADDKAHEGRPKTDRRTWDKEAYAKKALERLAAIEAGENPDKVDDSDVGIFREAPADLPRVPGSQRAFLQTREKGVDFESKIGVRQVRTGVRSKTCLNRCVNGKHVFCPPDCRA